MTRAVFLVVFSLLLAAQAQTPNVAAEQAGAVTAAAAKVSLVPGRIDHSFAKTDWPWWRGPNHDGWADADQSPPMKWSSKENVVWKTPVPGRGHGSATVVGQQVFLATADHERQVQSVLCFDRATGKRLWETEIHQGGFTTAGNGKSSLASGTVACDGERLFINFLNDGAVYATALSLDGQELWQTKVSNYVMHQGFGASPAIYGPLVIIASDHKGGGMLAGLNRTTGEIVWTVDRPKLPNYASPIVHHLGGHDQLLFIGCNLITSLEPLTGKKRWEIAGSTEECVTSIVTDGQRVFSSGGYPKNHVAAIQADGSGKIVWQNSTRVYVPSMLIRDGHLYAASDNGVAMCWKSDSGEVAWQGRLGGTFSSSPVLVGDKIFATNEAGETFIYRADPAKFELLGENKLGDEVMATPTICGGRIYHRVAEQHDGKRQEMLYCLGNDG